MAADMSKDMISTIREAEEEAAQIKKDADARAQRLLAEATAKAGEQAKNAEKEAFRKAKELLAEAEKDSAAQISSQSARFYEKTAKLRENAEKRVQNAADFILKELFAL